MKIAYCITRMDEIGGAQVHLRDIALAYKAQSHDIYILSGSLGGITTMLQNHGIHIIEVSCLKRSIHPVYDLLALGQMIRILHQIKPDIVSCHSSKAGLLGRLAAKICGLKSIFTVHGWAFTEGVPTRTAKLYRFLEKWVAKITAHIITVSDYDKNLALSYDIAPANQMTTIHNAIPDSFVSQTPLSDDKPFRLLMVARFSAPKEHGQLLKALKECLDINWTLDLVGAGDSKPYQEYCAQNGLCDRVNFLGERKDVPDILRQTDAFVLISWWEGLPISILEAMRAALPVIASDVGGVKESVINGQTGYLVPRGDIKSLAKALRDLMTDKEKAREMGRAGRLFYDTSFSFDQFQKRTMAVYQMASHL